MVQHLNVIEINADALRFIVIGAHVHFGTHPPAGINVAAIDDGLSLFVDQAGRLRRRHGAGVPVRQKPGIFLFVRRIQDIARVPIISAIGPIPLFAERLFHSVINGVFELLARFHAVRIVRRK